PGGVILHGMHRYLHIDVGAVLPATHGLEGDRAPLEGLGQPRARFVSPFGRNDQVVESAPESVLPFMAEDRPRAMIPKEDRPFPREGDQGIGRLLDKALRVPGPWKVLRLVGHVSPRSCVQTVPLTRSP